MCDKCRERCTDDGGVVNWPLGFPVITIGGMTLNLDYQYPGAP